MTLQERRWAESGDLGFDTASASSSQGKGQTAPSPGPNVLLCRTPSGCSCTQNSSTCKLEAPSPVSVPLRLAQGASTTSEQTQSQAPKSECGGRSRDPTPALGQDRHNTSRSNALPAHQSVRRDEPGARCSSKSRHRSPSCSSTTPRTPLLSAAVTWSFGFSRSTGLPARELHSTQQAAA